MSTNLIDVDSGGFATDVIERSHTVPVVVDFWAEWCGPCKVLGPTLERLAEEGGGSWILAKVDVDQNQQLAGRFGVQGIPTVVAFKDGEPVSRFTGALPEAQVRAFIDSFVPSELDEAAEHAARLADEGRIDEAEAAYRSVLAADASHEDAGMGLAGILLERGEAREAVEVLERLGRSEPVVRMLAAARLSDVGDLAALEQAAADGAPEDRLSYARGLAAAGRHEDALTILLDLVSERHEGLSDDARLTMLDVFDVLGPDHPLTAEYRRRLASALF
jgi:putative thioredoxin